MSLFGKVFMVSSLSNTYFSIITFVFLWQKFLQDFVATLKIFYLINEKATSLSCGIKRFTLVWYHVWSLLWSNLSPMLKFTGSFLFQARLKDTFDQIVCTLQQFRILIQCCPEEKIETPMSPFPSCMLPKVSSCCSQDQLMQDIMSTAEVRKKEYPL